MDMHALPTTEVYRAVIARDRKERNKDLKAPEMLTMMMANLPGGRGASAPLGAMFRSKDSLVVAIDTTHAPCDVMKTGIQTLAIRFFHSWGIVLFHGIDGQLVRFSSRSDGNTRSAPSGAPERAHATPAPPSYDSSEAPKTAVLLLAPRSAQALDLHVQAGFLGPYVSFKPTRPPYEHQQAHLVVYEKEESALLAHDFKYGDAAFAPLHRNLLALEKILPAQDPDVAEQEQPTLQRLQAGAALGSTAFVSQLVSALRDRPATGLTERISEWNAAPDDADAATPTPGPSRIKEMSETGVPLLAPLWGEATTLLPPDHDAPPPPPGDTNRPPPPYWFFLRPRRILREPRGNGKKGSPRQDVGEIPRTLSPTLRPRIPRPGQSHRHVPHPGRVLLYPPNLQCRAGAARTLPLTKSRAQCISRERASATTGTTPC